MKHDSAAPRRHSIRLRRYDYSEAGAYFVTLCAQDRRCLFGRITQGQARLNEAGAIVRQCWHDIPFHFPRVELDCFVVMPNHIHGIIALPYTPADAATHPRRGAVSETRRGAACRAHRKEQFGRPTPGSIPTIIRSFKSAATKRVNELRQTPGATLWQRNYWERVIRDERELNLVREYILNNPAQWELDKLHPHSSAPSGLGSSRGTRAGSDDEPWMV